MVNYGSIWSSGMVFCQRCHKQKQGLSLKSMKMAEAGLSLDLCSKCIGEIASEAGEI